MTLSKNIQQKIALLGGAIAWSFHLAAMYFVGEAACVIEGQLFSIFGASFAVLLMILISVVAVAGAFYSILISRRIHKRSSNEDVVGGEGGAEFVGRAGVLLNFLFLVAIIAQIVPLFFLVSERC